MFDTHVTRPTSVPDTALCQFEAMERSRETLYGDARLNTERIGALIRSIALNEPLDNAERRCLPPFYALVYRKRYRLLVSRCLVANTRWLGAAVFPYEYKDTLVDWWQRAYRPPVRGTVKANGAASSAHMADAARRADNNSLPFIDAVLCDEETFRWVALIIHSDQPRYDQAMLLREASAAPCNNSFTSAYRRHAQTTSTSFPDYFMDALKVYSVELLDEINTT